MTPKEQEQVRTSIVLEKRIMKALGREWSPDLGNSVWNLVHELSDAYEKLLASQRRIAEYPQGQVYSAGYAPADAEALVEIAKQALIGR